MDTLLSDAALTTRARQGDNEAFRALYERHRPAVERVCHNWVRDPHLVEDAVQEVFFRAYRALPRFSGGSDIRRWLRRIAKNYCHDVWRAQSRVDVAGTPDSMYAEPADPATANMANEAADRLAMQAVLRNLDRRDAMLLVERHLGGAPVAALASRWGMTRSSMDVALHRARQRARYYASAEGLRSLLPVDLLRRLSTLARRVGEMTPDASIVAAGVCHLAIVAALVFPVPVVPPHAEQAEAGSAGTVIRTGPLQHWVERRVARAPRVTSAREAGPARVTAEAPALPPTRERAEATSPDSAGDGPLDNGGVPIPGTGQRIHRDPPPPSERDRSIGAWVGDEDIAVDTYDAEGKSVPHEVACAALAPASSVAYCDP